MYIDGYINIDNKSMYHGDMRVDVVQDIFTLQWENNSVDEILLSHFAMYISYQEMSVLLKRWYNWLRKGGRLIMETGNVKSIAKTILESEIPKCDKWYEMVLCNFLDGRQLPVINGLGVQKL